MQIRPQRNRIAQIHMILQPTGRARLDFHQHSDNAWHRLGDWIASAEHRAIVLRPGFRRVGVGSLQGTFDGTRGALVVTADFAGS